MQEQKPPTKTLIEARVFLTTIIIIGILMISAGVASYVIPAGKFKEIALKQEHFDVMRQQLPPVVSNMLQSDLLYYFPSATQDPTQGVQIKVRSYEPIAQTPVPVWKILLAPLLSVTGQNGPKIIVLVLFILIIGGSFSIMNKSGVLPALLSLLVDRFAHRKTLFLLISIALFSFLGASLGILEEIVPMILFFVPIAYRMGWDSITGMAIPFLSAGFGFAAAMFNPFTIGTAQKIAGIPIFSGLSLRVPFFIITVLIVMAYMLFYTRKIERDPHKSPVYELDRVRKQNIDLNQPATAEIQRPRWVAAYMLGCFVLIGGVVLGGIEVAILQALAFPLIALIFLAMGLGVGLLAGVSVSSVTRYFAKGLVDFAPAIMLILMAASVGYLIEIGNIMDTMLLYVSDAIRGLGQGAAVISLYFFQTAMNMLVPSGTGQAVLTIPILAPLGDLIGISRQTVVLAFQFGDGFSNLIWPTNAMLLIALGLAGISYKDWFKWIWPLQIMLMLLSISFLLLAVAIGYN
jgi:uncharacterized ion transporter superfamily protein YfcC